MIRACLFLVILLAGACRSDKDYLITIRTEYGDMKVILYEDTPEHKDNFLELAQKGYYDSALFHRVIKDFMIQTGDPDTRDAAPGEAVGSGGPGYTLPAELETSHFHKKGAIGAARQDDRVNPEKRSHGSQFYIIDGTTFSKEFLTTDMKKLGEALQQYLMRARFDSLRDRFATLYKEQKFKEYNELMLSLKPDIEEELDVDLDKKISQEELQAYTTIGGAPHLDETYTVFGEVLEGLEVIDRIADTPTNKRDRPLEDIHVVIEVEEMPKRKITKLYGYEYDED